MQSLFFAEAVLLACLVTKKKASETNLKGLFADFLSLVPVAFEAPQIFLIDVDAVAFESFESLDTTHEVS
jgi:hypothetical protein